MMRSSSFSDSVDGIAGHAAFAAAERQVDDRALPRHPERERRHFVKRHAGMVADAALGRTAREVVLHAIAGVDFELAVVALKRDREDDLARRVREDAAHVPAVESSRSAASLKYAIASPNTPRSCA